RILEDGLAAHEVDLVPRDVGVHDLTERADDLLFAVHEVVDRELWLHGVVDPVQSALPQPGEIQRRLAQRLGGNSAGVDARATDVRLSLDEGDALAEVGRLRGAFFTGGARADHDQVVAIHARLPYVGRSAGRKHGGAMVEAWPNVTGSRRIRFARS